MSFNTVSNFTHDLKLTIARAAEFEHNEYMLSITIGSKGNGGEVRYGLAMAHRTMLPEALFEAACLNEVAVFKHKFDQLPTTVLLCHVKNVPRDAVATHLNERLREAASLPVPINTGDVEFRTIKFWTDLECG